MAEERKEVPARCTEITPATAPGEAEHADVAEWSGKKHDFCKEIEGIPRFLIEELKKISYNISKEQQNGFVWTSAQAGTLSAKPEYSITISNR